MEVRICYFSFFRFFSHFSLFLTKGFIVVPGFKNHIVEWTKATQSLKAKYGKFSNFIVLPKTEPIYKRAIRVTCRAGSMVLWDQQTAHGSQPNDSENIRYAQFFKIFPASYVLTEERRKKRSSRIAQLVEQKGFQESLTPLGKRMFGIEPWE
jgi:ectoine hydroxylase-related dioxygenase (phytanoyl-CoA dioxygenase family)